MENVDKKFDAHEDLLKQLMITIRLNTESITDLLKRTQKIEQVIREYIQKDPMLGVVCE